MTPRPCAARALRVTGLVLALTTGAAPLSYAVTYAPYAALGAVSRAAEPGVDASRAGSRPGEGRARPGREEPTGRAETGTAEPTYTDRDTAAPGRPEESGAQDPSPGAAPVQQSVVRPGQAPEPVLRIVPLGSGLILIGLGLGLAFLALRIRRG